jgi:hypothetical protein
MGLTFGSKRKSVKVDQSRRQIVITETDKRVTQDALLALADRCEAASGPDTELDAEIALAAQELPYSIPPKQAATKRLVTDCDGTIRILWEAVEPRLTSYVAFNYNPLLFTASIDAALTLVPEGHIVALTNCGVNDPTSPDLGRATAVIGASSDIGTEPVEAATLALAICAAALRAKASQ